MTRRYLQIQNHGEKFLTPLLETIRSRRQKNFKKDIEYLESKIK